jgi:putative ABC transport system permease protein
MVVAQVALSMTLLVASGLLLRSFVRLQDSDPGFEPESLITASVQLPGFKYESGEGLGLAWNVVLDRVRAVPGVESVAGADWLPVTSGGGPWNALSREDQPLEEGEMGTLGARKFVTSDYFETLGIPILAGRGFTVDESPGSPPVLVLSQTLAEQMFEGESPLGRRVMLWGSPWEVVGVAADVSESGLGNAGRPAFFVSTRQVPQERLQVVLRTRGANPLAVANLLRQSLLEADPDITVTPFQTMEARISTTLSQPRFRTGMVGAFSAVGLILAAFGLYGVLAFLVARRKHEIGIRIAVGAGSATVMALIIRHGLSLVGKGAAFGLVGGLGAAFLLQRLLFGVRVLDPPTMLGATTMVVAVGLVASLLPAWRAVKVDPLESLRAE